jgi:hypothetical protein
MNEALIRCPHCAVSLNTAGLTDSTVLLCARCGWPMVLRTLGDRRRLSRRAVASLVLGVCTVLFWCLAGVPAVILGAWALYDIHRDDERLKGRELAYAGILSGALLGLFCTPFVLMVAAGIVSSMESRQGDVIRVDAVGKKLQPLGIRLVVVTGGPRGNRSALFSDRDKTPGVLVSVQEYPDAPDTSTLESGLLAEAGSRGLYVYFDTAASSAFAIAGGTVEVNLRRAAETETHRPLRLYHGVMAHSGRHVAAVILTCDPLAEDGGNDGRRSLTQAEVQEFFEWYAAELSESNK